MQSFQQFAHHYHFNIDLSRDLRSHVMDTSTESANDGDLNLGNICCATICILPPTNLKNVTNNNMATVLLSTQHNTITPEQIANGIMHTSCPCFLSASIQE
eukprot:scaffold13606_cov84-Skeletonema_dohrnii-CCMP3373.AAC.1